MCYLDDNMSFPGACTVQFPVFLHHNDLPFLLHLLHVLLNLVEDAAEVLLGYTYKLEEIQKQYCSLGHLQNATLGKREQKCKFFRMSSAND